MSDFYICTGCATRRGAHWPQEHRAGAYVGLCEYCGHESMLTSVTDWSWPADGMAEQPTMVRTFVTGATRDLDIGKLDFEGFLSPLAIERFAEYMDKHRAQPDGSRRDSDNWQKGITFDSYMKSLWRHFHEAWKLHRVGSPDERQIEEALCGVLFNAQGYLHEMVKKRLCEKKT